MVKVSLFLLVILIYLCKNVNSNVEVTPMLEIFDAMQAMMTGEDFNRAYYEELTNCMDSLNPAIKPSQDGAWQGVIDYWDSRGTTDDPWGQRTTSYIEYNVTSTEIRGMTIYEPCGYSSNVAYYYPLTEICNRYADGKSFSMDDKFVQSITKGFSQLAMGSSFMHGSHTSLGSQQDNKPLAALAYEFHQASLDPLERSPILHDLDYNYRQFTAFEMIEHLDYMYTNLHVTEWKDYTDSLFIPHYMLIYSGLICTIMTLSLEPNVVDAIVPVAASVFGVPDSYVAFIEDDYLPELRNATSELNLNIIQRTRLLGNSVGTLVKLVYAFVWQETILTDNSILFTPEVNEKGTELLPEVNKWASRLQSFKHYNQDFQDGINVYPGDMFCNPILPHPKWHLQSAIGLLDLTYLSDEVHKTLARL